MSLALVLPAICALAQQVPTAADGQQAYLFAYPLVLMDVTKEASGGANPHRFTHLAAFPDAKFRTVVRPNADTLYSLAWVDLTTEPVLMKVPDTKGRYYLMQVLDAWTETIGAPGKRTTGTGEGWFAITGSGWNGKLPAGVQRIESATNLVWIIGRVQTNGPADYANVHAVQRGMRLMPLSRHPDGGGEKQTVRTPPAAARGLTPPEIVEQMSDIEFFNRFLRLLRANPPHAADEKMSQSLASLGWKPGVSIDALPVGEFLSGVAVARKLLASIEQLRTTRVGSSGWTALNPNIGRYGTNYLARAVVARVGLGGNPPEDAVYLMCYRDSAGKPLDSGQSYRLHFKKSELPAVNAFWSITMCDPPGYFVENPAGRYAIGDRDPLVYNADGSLDLYIQREPPAVKANWLPAPASGLFVLSFRLYWPRDEILKGKWQPPPLLPAAQ